MSSLRFFIREALLYEDVTVQSTWQKPTGTGRYGRYGETGESGKVRSAIVTGFRGARTWWKNARDAYSRSDPKKGKAAAYRNAWSASAGYKTSKWKIVGAGAVGLGLVSWGLLNWFNSEQQKPDQTKLEAAEGEIKEFYDSVMGILNGQSNVIMREFRTEEVINPPATTLDMDALITKYKENYEKQSTRLTDFTGIESDNYNDFFSVFEEFGSVKPLIDAEITKRTGGSADKQRVFQKTAMICLIYSAAYEISEASLADLDVLNSGVGVKDTDSKEKVRRAGEAVSSSIDTKFKNDQEINESVDYIESMNKGE